jgi:hypothetical protein
MEDNDDNYDPFLSDYLVIERLVLDWFKYDGWIIAYDYDNTVYDYHNRGYKFDSIIELLQECKQYNSKFIVYTHSNDDRHDEIKTYLDNNDIPWDTINKGIAFANGKEEGKLLYSTFLDDRAGLKSAYLCLCGALEILKQNPADKDEACEMIGERYRKGLCVDDDNND